MLAVSLSAVPAAAQTSQTSQASQGQPASHANGTDADLAQQLTNPVASLVSVPFQFNWDQPVGLDDDTRLTLNFQPVVPFSVTSEWNLIVRWIMPYVGQPRLFEGALPTSGLSDIVTSLFFSPAQPGALIWAVGPVFLLPTTSDPLLGSGKWGAGPTFVVLKQTGGWTYGALANHIWSVAGDDFTGGVPRSDVNSTFLQPFLSYTTSNAVTLTANAEASANWEAAADEWTVPVHLTASKLTRFGSLPMSVGGGVGIFVVAPDGNPDWRLRFVATLLLPRGR